MTLEELNEEISIELEYIGATVKESVELLDDFSTINPAVREKTAAAAFLAQFYGGIENILKRIHRYHGIPLPLGDSWHLEIFKRFCHPPLSPFPAIFDESLEADLLPFRKFRHVVHHGYGFQLDWVRMKEGLEKVEGIHSRFVSSISNYLTELADIN